MEEGEGGEGLTTVKEERTQVEEEGEEEEGFGWTNYLEEDLVKQEVEQGENEEGHCLKQETEEEEGERSKEHWLTLLNQVAERDRARVMTLGDSYLGSRKRKRSKKDDDDFELGRYENEDSSSSEIGSCSGSTEKRKAQSIKYRKLTSNNVSHNLRHVNAADSEKVKSSFQDVIGVLLGTRARTGAVTDGQQKFEEKPAHEILPEDVGTPGCKNLDVVGVALSAQNRSRKIKQGAKGAWKWKTKNWLECPLCDFKFASKARLRNHYESYVGSHKCSACTAIFNKGAKCYNHIRKCHGGKGIMVSGAYLMEQDNTPILTEILRHPLQCIDCTAVLFTEYQFATHLRGSHPKLFASFVNDFISGNVDTEKIASLVTKLKITNCEVKVPWKGFGPQPKLSPTLLLRRRIAPDTDPVMNSVFRGKSAPVPKGMRMGKALKHARNKAVTHVSLKEEASVDHLVVSSQENYVYVPTDKGVTINKCGFCNVILHSMEEAVEHHQSDCVMQLLRGGPMKVNSGVDLSSETESNNAEEPAAPEPAVIIEDELIVPVDPDDQEHINLTPDRDPLALDDQESFSFSEPGSDSLLRLPPLPPEEDTSPYCTTCNKKFSSPMHLQRHIRNMHYNKALLGQHMAMSMSQFAGLQ